MNKLSTLSSSHRRLASFVDWIRTPAEREEAITEQAEEIRTRVKGQAEKDGLTVRSMPFSGSFKKKTGLRRHMHGGAEIEGQDVDISFVLHPDSVGDEDRSMLIERFLRYVKASYPSTPSESTRSSVRIEFAGTKINYDLVPMIAVVENDVEQLLFRSNGEKRRTSVRRHIEFITTRTKSSNDTPGRVLFNECIRLVKWWRCYREGEARVIEEVPSMLIDLLCAKAYDERGVATTYTETLGRWLSWMADAIASRRTITFADFGQGAATSGDSRGWSVLDPVNAGNNVMPMAWKDAHVRELQEWLAAARDCMAEVEALDRRGDAQGAREVLIELFGAPFKHHGDLS